MGETPYRGHCLKPAAQSMAGAAAGAGGGVSALAGGGGSAAIGGGIATSGSPEQSPETGCIASSELCDLQDNDCDGEVDESLTRACGPSSRGQCRAGTETCEAGVWGECSGAAEPKDELCDAEFLDEDCDGASNEGCTCAAGDQKPCAKSEGVCDPGFQRCAGGAGGAGGTWGTCEGAGPTTEEVCDPGRKDEDCDGMMNEDCECAEAETATCDTGRNGVCSAGIKMCRDGAWARCVAMASPGTEVCDEMKLDEDCDGEANEGCCEDGAEQECETERQGACSAGTQRCDAGRWGVCESEVESERETCDGIDNDCNGTADDGAVCPEGQRCEQAGGTAGAHRCIECTRATEARDCASEDACVRARCGDDGMCERQDALDDTPCETTAGAPGVCRDGVCSAGGEVVCYVHGDDPADRSEPASGVHFQPAALGYVACVADTECNAWFACETTNGVAVDWSLFDDNGARVLEPVRSLVAAVPDQAYASDNPLEPRKWFGRPRARDGRAIECRLFNDDRRPLGGRYREFHLGAPDRLCAPDGTCGKWFGMCELVE